MSTTRSVWPALGLALVLTVLAVLVHGYKYNYSDQWIWVPVAQKFIDPALYHHDFLINNAPDVKFTLFPQLVGTLGAHVGLPWSFFLVYLACQMLINLAALSIGRTLSGSWVGGLALAVVLLRLKLLPASLYPLTESYLAPKMVATALLFVALGATLRRDFRLGAPLGALGALFQPVVLGPYALWLGVEGLVEWVRRPRARRQLVAGALLAVAVIGAKMLLVRASAGGGDFRRFFEADAELIRRAFTLHRLVTNPWAWQPADLGLYLLIAAVLLVTLPQLADRALRGSLLRYLAVSVPLLLLGLGLLRFHPVNFFIFAQPTRIGLHPYLLALALATMCAVHSLRSERIVEQAVGAALLGTMIWMGKQSVPLYPLWGMLVLLQGVVAGRRAAPEVAKRIERLMPFAALLGALYLALVFISDHHLVVEPSWRLSLALVCVSAAALLVLARVAGRRRLGEPALLGAVPAVVGLTVVLVLVLLGPPGLRERTGRALGERVMLPWRASQGAIWELQRWVATHTERDAVLAISYKHDEENLLRLDSRRGVFYVEQDCHGLYVYYTIPLSDAFLEREAVIRARPWRSRAGMQRFLARWPEVSHLVLQRDEPDDLGLAPVYENDGYRVLELGPLGRR